MSFNASLKGTSQGKLISRFKNLWADLTFNSNVRLFMKRIGDMAGLGELLKVATTVGVGGLGYVCFTWLMSFVHSGQYFAAVALVFVATVILSLAVARVPLALFLLFGGAAVIGTAFFTGVSNILLP
jgi:hypothetical protein